MTVRKPENHREDIKCSNKGSDYFEKHPSKISFFTNISLILITVISLITTSYFSFKNLNLSSQQFKASVNQFNYQRRLDSINDLDVKRNEKRQSIKETSDSANQAKKDSLQVIKDINQESLNRQQLVINKRQLLTSESQAKTTARQFDEQEEQYKEQSYEKKPYFMIDNVNVDSSNSYKPKVSFTFSNKGIRSAHIDSAVLAFYNGPLGCNSITPNTSNLEAPPQQFSLHTSEINIYDDCLKSPNTVFLLLIFYRDFATQLPQNEKIFFQYSHDKQNQFVYKRLNSYQVQPDFKKFLNKKGIDLH